MTAKREYEFNREVELDARIEDPALMREPSEISLKLTMNHYYKQAREPRTAFGEYSPVSDRRLYF